MWISATMLVFTQRVDKSKLVLIIWIAKSCAWIWWILTLAAPFRIYIENHTINNRPSAHSFQVAKKSWAPCLAEATSIHKAMKRARGHYKDSWGKGWNRFLFFWLLRRCFLKTSSMKFWNSLFDVTFFLLHSDSCFQTWVVEVILPKNFSHFPWFQVIDLL